MTRVELALYRERATAAEAAEAVARPGDVWPLPETVSIDDPRRTWAGMSFHGEVRRYFKSEAEARAFAAPPVGR